MRKGDRTTFLIGESLENNAKCKYTIIGYPKDTRRRYIKFDSGYECCPLVSQLKNGKVRDLNNKTYYNIACLGYPHGTQHPLYWRWLNMIGRCYNQKHSQYKFYGDKGVTVSNELLNFNNYINIVSQLDNYDKLLQNPNNWDVDKDMKSLGDKLYSKDTLSIILKVDNALYGQKDHITPVNIYDDNMTLMAMFPSKNKASKVINADVSNISRAINDCVKYKGYFWRVNE